MLCLLIVRHFSLVPLASEGASLIAFTGDSELNTALRLRASRRGLLLDEFGLWHWHAGGSWELIEAPTERHIFDKLEIDYIEPHQRNNPFDITAHTKPEPPALVTS